MRILAVDDEKLMLERLLRCIKNVDLEIMIINNESTKKRTISSTKGALLC